MPRPQVVAVAAAIVVVLAGAAGWRTLASRESLRARDPHVPVARVHDEAGIIPSGDVSKFEQYLGWVHQESDVDLRFVFVRDLGGTTLEEAAARKVHELRIGGTSREERGVLFLYDLADQRLRIEVGYGLEAYLPDGFVAYLMHDHARDFFETGDVSTGLRLTIRLLHDRIREEVLGDRYDPRALEILSRPGYLSGGAGASSPMALASAKGFRFRTTLDPAARARYVAQETPAQTYRLYLDWIAGGRYDPDIEIFDAATRKFLVRFPMTRAYFEYIFMKEYGRAYEIDVRGDLALLYFTDTPLVDPHFFRRNASGLWQMDIGVEVRNTVNVTGGRFGWMYRGQDDDFSTIFRDRIVLVDGYPRIRGGDNRPLPTRWDPVAR